MNKDNKKLTTRGQTLIELACIGAAILLWIILLMLGGLTEFFFVVLIAYHVIGGLLNRDIAQSMVGAILLAPIYVGRKFAIYFQTMQVEDRFKELTANDLADLNSAIVSILNEHPNRKETMKPAMFGCATYEELNAFNDSIVAAYNKLTK